MEWHRTQIFQNRDPCFQVLMHESKYAGEEVEIGTDQGSCID